jgi:hypothetical protein
MIPAPSAPVHADPTPPTPAWKPGVGRRVAHVGVVAALVTALFASRVPMCPMAAILGHPCPACGLTRATYALARADIAAAFSLHPLVFIATPALGLLVAIVVRSYVKEGTVRWHPRVDRMLAPGMLTLYVALIAVWIARYLGALGGPVPV